MSNIIFKGDTIKDFGEFYPNIYIDRVVVRNNGSENVFLDISYSLFFHITDEFDKEDIADILQNINFYFAVSNEQDKNNQLLTKQQLISDIKKPTLLSDPIGSSARTSFYPFSKEGITENLNNNAYTDDVYDSQDRRVMIINSEETISYSTFERDESHVYLYAFTSLYDLSGIQQLNMDALNTQTIYDLSIGDVSYEKVFSPNFNILRQAQIIYLDVTGAKYSDTPLLSLNALYYKNEAAKRQLMVDKVKNLVKRFTPKNNLGPLAEMAASINYVISQFGASENLLVELDRVRKSFPNKTNNNPIGNLYASFSKLLININSSFSAGDVLSKERIVTGKVIDNRGEVRQNYMPIQQNSEQEIIPEDGFFIERTRLSVDEQNDLSSNGGFFHIRYEEIVKRMSKISQLVNIERMLEFPIPSLESEMERLLFSFLKTSMVKIIKYDRESDQGLSQNGITYDPITRAQNPTRNSNFPGETTDSGKESYLKEYFLDLKGVTPEIITSYEFQDLDKYPATYELIQNEVGGMKFKYDIRAEFKDKTLVLASTIEKMYLKAIAQMEMYEELSSEICSYNNIENRFNDFFITEINKYYDEVREQLRPWDTSVYLYSFVQYILTDRFDNVSDVANYSRNLIKSINPSSGTLDSIRQLLLEMQQFRDQMFGTTSEYFSKKIELSETSEELVFEKSFDVNLITQNIDILETEAEQEIEFFINLFNDDDFIAFLDPDSYKLAFIGSDQGVYYITGTATPRSFSIRNYFKLFATDQISTIFSETSFKLKDVNRVTGGDGTSYSLSDGGAFTHNLTEIMEMGVGDDTNDVYRRLRVQDRQYIINRMADFIGNWMANMFYDAKKDRDASLRAGKFSEILGLDVGFLDGQRASRGDREIINIGYYLYQIIDGSFENEFKEAFYDALNAAEGGSIDDITNGSKNSVKNFIFDFTIGLSAKNALKQIIYSIYAYYRETNRQGHLFPPPPSLSAGFGSDQFTTGAVITFNTTYNSIKDSVTELPTFITDADPYIKYTGPPLEEIPGLREFIEDSGL
tara:strand:+ start:6455 stop:9562 length:3108 start_codon:yes stop_codon:yes gene_type:complete